MFGIDLSSAAELIGGGVALLLVYVVLFHRRFLRRCAFWNWADDALRAALADKYLVMQLRQVVVDAGQRAQKARRTVARHGAVKMVLEELIFDQRQTQTMLQEKLERNASGKSGERRAAALRLADLEDVSRVAAAVLTEIDAELTEARQDIVDAEADIRATLLKSDRLAGRKELTAALAEVRSLADKAREGGSAVLMDLMTKAEQRVFDAVGELHGTTGEAPASDVESDKLAERILARFKPSPPVAGVVGGPPPV